MKRLVSTLAVLAVLLMATSAFAQTYGFSLSGSTTTGCINTGAHAPGVISVHVWYNYYSNVESLSAADLTLIHNPANTVLAFTPGANWTNFAGPGDQVILGIGGCPEPPLRAGAFLVSSTVADSYSLGGSLSAADCQVPAGQFPISVTGFATDGNPPATVDGDGNGSTGCSTSVDPVSWGSVKALYR